MLKMLKLYWENFVDGSLLLEQGRQPWKRTRLTSLRQKGRVSVQDHIADDGTSGSFHSADPLEDVSNVPSLASEAPSQQNVS